MAQRIGRDRTMLCRNAGVDDSSWQKVDAWIKSDAARGNSNLWAKEQKAIIEHLESQADARTFFVLDAATGKETSTAPVLWIGGCQSVGAEPAVLKDGRLLIFYRSAYGNWNHGVAPLVALGLLDLPKNRITPLLHQQGKQPGWNNFWGTADESQNFVVAGNTVVIVHQGTLSGFDLETNRLFPIHGERDTYGGFRSPAWARNEWHGPGRSGVAIAGKRIYWQTGSRVLCLGSGEQSKAADPITIQRSDVPNQMAPASAPPSAETIRQELSRVVSEVISRKWAPLFVDPGLAGRDFSFDKSAELFEALAWAFPHLPGTLKVTVKETLAREWIAHPPFSDQATYSLKQGEPREWFSVPDDFRARLGSDKQPLPFGNVHAVWRCATRCDEEALVLESWPQIKNSFDQFVKSGWQLDATKGDLFANRYLASLLAFERMAERQGDAASAAEAKAKGSETANALISWWHRAAEQGTIEKFKGSAELDPFINRGDDLSFRVAPHRHKLALFQDLTSEVARVVKERASDDLGKVWDTFAQLYLTWHLMGEERQVHFGENFVDPPELALGAFKTLAWLKSPGADELARKIDLPFCKADLYYLTKLALALETKERW